MTNYFKVYLKGSSGIERHILKKKEEVIGLINKANKQGYESYIVVKRLKQGTDVPVSRGTFDKECEVVYVNGLDTDWQVEGSLVTVRNRKKEEKGTGE